MTEYINLPPKGSILALPQEDGSWRFRVHGCNCAPGCSRAYHESLAEAERCSEQVLARARIE